MGENSRAISESYDEGSARHTSFTIAGVSVCVRDQSGAAVRLVPSLYPFRSQAPAFDIDVEVEWLANLQTVRSRTLFDSGMTWRLFEHQDGFQFDFGSHLSQGMPYRRLLVDTGFKQARLTMSESVCSHFFSNVEPLDYPLDELLIMHRLTQERAIELHGTGIVRANGVANLFVGHSGAGKSTTTRLWTSLEEVEVLSDDRIIVRYDDGRDGPAGPNQMRMYGTPWHGEAMFASPNSAPLSRIFVLEHGHGNVITRLSRSEAVGELFARAFVPFHRHEYIDNALSFLEQLAGSVPVYRYDFEPDERAIQKIQQFND